MAKHVIFLIHGMGSFSKDWSADTQKQISSLYATYNIATQLPFDDLFRFEEITYNGRFDKLRKQWKDGAAGVLRELKKGGLPESAAKDLANTEADSTTEEFFGSHVLDVLLYRFIPQVAEEARTLVSKRIQEVIASGSGDTPRWSVIAHSLGTAVAHDSLHAMFTQKVEGRSLQQLTKAQAVIMVANVGRLLEQNSVDVYKSVVCPGFAEHGTCDFYLNIWHEWDPFPRPKAFRPLNDWPDVATRQLRPERFVAAPINAFQHKNVHALSHYLSDPKAHVPILRALSPMAGAITDEELRKASAAHEAATPFGQFEALQAELKKLQIAEEASWKEIIATFKGFFATIRKF